jgi:hypothetical protein
MWAITLFAGWVLGVVSVLIYLNLPLKEHPHRR